MQMMLAEEWYDGIDPTGWLMSEKIDGYRARWDGRRLVSRQGNCLNAPAWFLATLPSLPLDGELWAGRGGFERCASVIQGANSDRWTTLEFRAFDAPTVRGDFETRLAAIPAPWRVAHVVCDGVAHLQETLARIVDAGGEGLVLRNPRGAYINGRSGDMLKAKPEQDAEGIVIGYSPVGAPRIRSANGKTFCLAGGLSAQQPAIGSVITFRYRGFTSSGIPRHATFLREHSPCV